MYIVFKMPIWQKLKPNSTSWTLEGRLISKPFLSTLPRLWSFDSCLRIKLIHSKNYPGKRVIRFQKTQFFVKAQSPHGHLFQHWWDSGYHFHSEQLGILKRWYPSCNSSSIWTKGRCQADEETLHFCRTHPPWQVKRDKSGSTWRSFSLEVTFSVLLSLVLIKLLSLR